MAGSLRDILAGLSPVIELYRQHGQSVTEQEETSHGLVVAQRIMAQTTPRNKKQINTLYRDWLSVNKG
jgi:hypothetical protein